MGRAYARGWGLRPFEPLSHDRGHTRQPVPVYCGPASDAPRDHWREPVVQTGEAPSLGREPDRPYGRVWRFPV